MSLRNPQSCGRVFVSCVTSVKFDQCIVMTASSRVLKPRTQLFVCGNSTPFELLYSIYALDRVHGTGIRDCNTKGANMRRNNLLDGSQSLLNKQELQGNFKASKYSFVFLSLAIKALHTPRIIDSICCLC